MPQMPPSYPVIVIPGITAAYLADDYPLPPDLIWTVMTKEYERAALHPDDLRYEAIEPARIRFGQLYEVAYKELIEELRHNLRDTADEDVPVYPFGYDWRQPLDVIEAQLSDFIDEVIARTGLMRPYNKAGYANEPKVNLVGHSMGGLIIAGYLQRRAKRSAVAKVATLATPFQGSFEAVIKITTGTADLGSTPPSSREREAARLTPALYHLMPSFTSGLDFDPSLPRTLFDPKVWQPSIIDTIKEYVRLHAAQDNLSDAERAARAKKLFTTLLEVAQGHRARTNGFTLDTAGLTPADWLCVAGVHATTRVRLKVVVKDGVPDFAFQSSDRDDKWDDPNPAQRRLTGDGTVPFEGAIPKFLEIQNLVCVTPDDYGYWEVQDRALTSVSGFHGILPNMDMLHRLIVAHFTGRADTHGNIWGRPAPGVTTDAWKPAVPNLPAKS